MHLRHYVVFSSTKIHGFHPYHPDITYLQIVPTILSAQPTCSVFQAIVYDTYVCSTLTRTRVYINLILRIRLGTQSPRTWSMRVLNTALFFNFFTALVVVDVPAEVLPVAPKRSIRAVLGCGVIFRGTRTKDSAHDLAARRIVRATILLCSLQIIAAQLCYFHTWRDMLVGVEF